MKLLLLGLMALSAVFCGPGLAFAQSPFGTIAISPASPTTNDPIVVSFTPAPGQVDLCPLHVSVTPTLVFIISNGCPPDRHPRDHMNIGRLPAGTYQVVWGVVDNFPNTLEPTATVVVAFAPPYVPTLSAVASFLLIGAILLISLRRLGPNYSFKRTGAERLR